MYGNYLSIASRVFGGALARHLVWIVPLLAVISLVMLCLPAWRKREAAAWKGESRFVLLTLLLAAAFRVLVVAAIAGGLCGALLAQKALFSEQHGCVTQRNFEAVRAKWGVPHEQHDLTVAHFIMRKVVKDIYSDGADDTVTLDERQPAAGDDSEIVVSSEAINPPTGDAAKNRYVTRRVTQWVRCAVAQDSISSAEVALDVSSNPRTLGGATYAGYEDQWQFTYVAVNRAEFATQASFSFPLPQSGFGVFDRLVVKVDGQDWIPRVRYGEGCLKWKVVMQPAESRKVEIGYASRGLQYLRYKPGNMRERCLVAMTLHGVPPGRLDYPIGSMPPLEDRSKLPGDNYTLHWDLSRAVSNYDIGIAMPRAEQPGYFVTQVLGAAPIGLVLLALMLLLTRWLIAGRLDLLPVSLALIAFYIGNALLANLNDVIASFALAFAVGTVPLGVAVCVFWWTMDGRGFLAAQSAALYLLLALIYPLLALSSASGTLLYFLYTILFIYVVGLVAWRSHRAREGHLLTAQ